MFRNQVEEFGRFVSHLEDDYHQIAKDPLSWNTTVGVLYDASYRSFINVSLYSLTYQS